MSPPDAENPKAPEAVILLSGGLDSATVLAMARERGFSCHAIAFDYAQRHRHELQAAERVARALGATSFRVFPLNLGVFGGSALTDPALAVPKDRDEAAIGTGRTASPTGHPGRVDGAGGAGGIPITYVPARNLVFLSIGLALAEVIGARDVFIGVNEVDSSGYPDCRPEFIASFRATADLATRAGSQGDGFEIHTPLIGMGKDEIILAGTQLGVDYSMTHSCYDPVARDGATLACARCDSCILRRSGFRKAGLPDPTRYAP